MEIKGELKELIFQNDVNGYTIAVLDTDAITPATNAEQINLSISFIYALFSLKLS